MNIDPRLVRLQNLIEEKRVQQGLENPPRVVGKPGNSKFAEAARRVEVSRVNKLNNNSFRLGGNYQSIRMEEAEVLPAGKNVQKGVGNSITLGMNRSTGNNSQSHLGRYLDIYA